MKSKPSELATRLNLIVGMIMALTLKTDLEISYFEILLKQKRNLQRSKDSKTKVGKAKLERLNSIVDLVKVFKKTRKAVMEKQV